MRWAIGIARRSFDLRKENGHSTPLSKRVLFKVDVKAEEVTIVLVGEKRGNSLIVQGEELADDDLLGRGQKAKLASYDTRMLEVARDLGFDVFDAG